MSYLLNESDPKISVKTLAALERAHDIRKFEIDLYWKRGTYFWTFIALAFTGYSLLKRDNADFELLLIVASLGFLFSLAWYCVNRGSNFWQRNWEGHVDLLENDIMGPLYKTILSDNQMSWWKIFGPYPYSPSRINHVLSLVVTAAWILLIIHTINSNASKVHHLKGNICESLSTISLWIVGLTVLAAVLILTRRSHLNEGVLLNIKHRDTQIKK